MSGRRARLRRLPLTGLAAASHTPGPSPDPGAARDSTDRREALGNIRTDGSPPSRHHQFFRTVAATTKLTGESVDAGLPELSESDREAAVRRARSPRARPFPIHAS